jgi:hypothetical protein
MWNCSSGRFLEQHKMQHCSDWVCFVEVDRDSGCVAAVTVAVVAGYYDLPLGTKLCWLGRKMNVQVQLHDASAEVKSMKDA